MNQNNGKSQTDIFIVDYNGKIDRSSPIIWDFNDITEISAIPIDEKQLIINLSGALLIIFSNLNSRY